MSDTLLLVVQVVEVVGIGVLAGTAGFETVTGRPAVDRVGRELTASERASCAVLVLLGLGAAGLTVSDHAWGLLIVPYLLLSLLVRRWLVYFDPAEGLAGRLGLADVSAAGRLSRRERREQQLRDQQDGGGAAA